MSNNKFIIDGPISYYYLVSDDNKKKILLFGDQHLPYEIIKGKSDINLLRFFKNCILLNEKQQFETVKNMPIIKCEYIN